MVVFSDVRTGGQARRTRAPADDGRRLIARAVARGFWPRSRRRPAMPACRPRTARAGTARTRRPGRRSKFRGKPASYRVRAAQASRCRRESRESGCPAPRRAGSYAARAPDLRRKAARSPIIGAIGLYFRRHYWMNSHAQISAPHRFVPCEFADRAAETDLPFFEHICAVADQFGEVQILFRQQNG
ncbi:hypothetical protein QFZ94_001285 [Paraburkholderia sp. JPY465]